MFLIIYKQKTEKIDKIPNVKNINLLKEKYLAFLNIVLIKTQIKYMMNKMTKKGQHKTAKEKNIPLTNRRKELSLQANKDNDKVRKITPIELYDSAGIPYGAKQKNNKEPIYAPT